MLRIEHIGIAVRDLRAANKIYESLLGYKHYKTEEVATEGVITSFFKCGESKVELLEGTSSESPISKFIEKRGEGIHHVAFYVDDIRAEMSRLEQEGFVLLNKEPRRGADNKMVAFIHPKSAHGVLIELCQDLEP